MRTGIPRCELVLAFRRYSFSRSFNLAPSPPSRTEFWKEPELVRGANLTTRTADESFSAKQPAGHDVFEKPV